LASRLSFTTLYNVVRDTRAGANGQIGLVVAGDADVAAVLASKLAGDAPGAEMPRLLAPGQTATIGRDDLVLLVAATDERLREVADVAHRERAELVALLPPTGAVAASARARDAGVYEDELVVAEPLAPSSFPVIAYALAGAAGWRGPALARRFPALREAVVQRLVQRTARQNGIFGALAFVPGADLPVMTLNQVRMVLNIGAAYGQDASQRLPEVLGVVGAGYGMRAVARQLAGMVPIAGWALKGSIGYAGTLAMGEAAVRYFESGVEPVGPIRVKGLLNKVVKRGRAATG
jgi:uncharacterized protein (DUF697 family)